LGVHVYQEDNHGDVEKLKYGYPDEGGGGLISLCVMLFEWSQLLDDGGTKYVDEHDH